ncbi:MAG TPA: YceI family protein [Luteibaculaceae bacterium]|nr:YceI family protein [Luteibaculaceae bacterium]
MKIIISTIALLASFAASAQVLKTSNCSIDFFSETPLENISAKNNAVKGAMNVQSKAIAFSVPIRSFKFEKALMEEHFNENYMESDKYPNGSFKGVINETINLSKNGTFRISATGKLNIHGVEQDRTLTGEATVKDGVLTITSNFKIKLVDHRIERPAILFQKIAEVIDVKLAASFPTQP